MLRNSRRNNCRRRSSAVCFHLEPGPDVARVANGAAPRQVASKRCAAAVLTLVSRSSRCFAFDRLRLLQLNRLQSRSLHQIPIGYRLQSVLLLQQWRHRVVRAHAGLHIDARLPRDPLLDQPVETHQRRTDIGDEEILEVDSFCRHFSSVNSIQVSKHCC